MRYRTPILAAVVASLLAAPSVDGLEPPPPGWNRPVLSRAVFSDDGKVVVAHFYQTSKSGLGNNILFTHVIDARTGNRLAEVPAGVQDFSALTPVVRPGRPEILLARVAAKAKSSTQQELVLWDYRKKAEVRVFTPTTRSVGSLGFSRDGKLAFTGLWDNRLLAWDVETGKRVRRFDRPWKGELSTAHIPNFFRPANGKRLITCYYQNSRVWDVGTGRVVAPKLGDHAMNEKRERYRLWACSDDGKLGLESTGYVQRGKEALRLRDLTTGNRVGDLAFPDVERWGVLAAAFAAGGKQVKILDGLGLLHTWDVATRKHRSRWPVFTGRPAAVFSLDGRWLLADGGKKTMTLWDAKTGKAVWEADVVGKDAVGGVEPGGLAPLFGAFRPGPNVRVRRYNLYEQGAGGGQR
jgi:hypothetical protein